MEKLYYKLKNKLHGYSDFEDKLYKSYYAYKSMCNWASGCTGIASQYENWYNSVVALAEDEKVVHWVLERRKCLDDYGYNRIIWYADKARKYLIAATFDISLLIVRGCNAHLAGCWVTNT